MIDVPVGYKQTDVGVIPEDWEVKSIYQLSRPVRGGSPRPAGSPKYFNGSFIPWLTVAALTNISSSQIEVIETASFLTEEGSLHSRILNKGTLIIANSGATLGVAKILGMKCCANDGIAALLDIPRNVNPFYLTHYFNTKTNHLRDVIATGNGQPNLNTELIGNIEIPLPPTLKEQTAIATALSDVDALLNQLDKLIAKKRDIKQATMQQLLTGKKRLAGFSGEWEVKKLGDVADFINGRAYGLFEWESQGTPVIRLQNLTGRGIDYYYSTLKLPEKQYCENGDLLFMWSATFGPVIWKGEKAIYHYHIWKVECKKGEAERLFLFYILSELTERLKNSSSSGGTMLHVTKEKMESIQISIPSIEEQNAIATLLTDMDTEITQLQQRRHKTHALKQGMMQQLLTGKIRLI
jgi:type I restriction enzyme S subunit